MRLTPRTLAVGLVGGLASGAWAGPIFRTVALTAAPAPGLPAGVTFTYLSDPRINASATVAFWAELAGPGVTTANDGSVWSERTGTLTLVQREGDLSGVGVLVYAAFPSPAMTIDGRISLLASLLDPAAPTAPINLAIFGEAAAPLRLLVARETEPQPPPGTATWAALSPPSLLGGGVAFSSNNGGGIWAASPGTPPVPVALSGQPAPGGAANFAFLDQPIGNNSGSMLFRATDSSLGPAAPSLWSAIGGTIAPVAIAGASAPGTPPGTVFAEAALQPAMAAGNNIAFWAKLTGGGTSAADDTGIWAGPAAAPLLVARETSPAPGVPVGVVFGPFSQHPAVSAAGGVAFSSDLLGPGIDANNNSAVFTTRPKGLALVAREGSQAPRLPEGALFAAFNEPAMSESGQVAFLARLRGTPVTTSTNSVLYVTDTAGRPYPLVRTGDLFEVGTGPARLVDEIIFDSDPGTGRAQLASGGLFIFKLVFRDPALPPSQALSHGVFTATLRCLADVNADNALNVNDFVSFSSAFAAANLREADFDGDGRLNVNDFVAFQQAFAGGCP